MSPAFEGRDKIAFLNGVSLRVNVCPKCYSPELDNNTNEYTCSESHHFKKPIWARFEATSPRPFVTEKNASWWEFAERLVEILFVLAPIWVGFGALGQAFHQHKDLEESLEIFEIPFGILIWATLLLLVLIVSSFYLHRLVQEIILVQSFRYLMDVMSPAELAAKRKEIRYLQTGITPKMVKGGVWFFSFSYLGLIGYSYGGPLNSYHKMTDIVASAILVGGFALILTAAFFGTLQLSIRLINKLAP